TIDNGRLEVVVAGWRGAAGFSQVAAQVVNPKLTPKFGPKLSTMERYLTTGIRVTSAQPQPAPLDGDTDPEATHMNATDDHSVAAARAARRRHRYRGHAHDRHGRPRRAAAAGPRERGPAEALISGRPHPPRRARPPAAGPP